MTETIIMPKYGTKNGGFEKYVTWVLVLSPILQTYGWGKFDFAFILTSIAGVWALFLNRISVRALPKFLVPYLLYWMLIHAISASSFQDIISLGVLKTFLVYCAFFNVVRLPLLVKYYRIVVWVSILFFAIQLLFKHLLDIYIPGVFSFLPLALDTEAAVFFEDRAASGRFSSFYSEPAFFAQFIIPFLCLTLFDKSIKNGEKVWKIGLIILTLFLMQSGNAVFGASICLLFYFLFRMKAGSASNKLQTIALGLIILVIAGYFVQTDTGRDLLSRKEQLSINSVDNIGYSTSGFERVYRGYFVYAEYPTLQKIIGNDNAEYKTAAAKRSVVSDTFLRSDDYLYYNTFQLILLNTGIIGVFIMLLLFIGLWKVTNKCGKDLLITFFAFSLFSSSYFSEIMCLFLLLPTLMSRYESNYD